MACQEAIFPPTKPGGFYRPTSIDYSLRGPTMGTGSDYNRRIIIIIIFAPGQISIVNRSVPEIVTIRKPRAKDLWSMRRQILA